MGNVRNGSSSLPWVTTVITAIFCLASQTKAQQCNAGDSTALLAFKADFNDPFNVFVTWVPGTNCCTWTGVTCDAAGRVSDLNLQTGRVPQQDTPNPNRNSNLPVGSSIGSLSGLVNFISSAVTFNGPIPGSWVGLTSLQQLRLTNTGFSGTIPDFLGRLPKITMIALFGGTLAGPIPASLCNQNLQELRFEGFQLNGPLPGCLGTLGNLNTLSFSGNRIGGIIPVYLSGLKKLMFFFLSTNRLTGIIPPSIGDLSSLQFLDFSNNQLTGPIPSSIGNLGALLSFRATVNFLSGPLPSTIGNLGQLGSLDVSFNRLTGMLPAGIGNLKIIDGLTLSHNLFFGNINPIGQLGQVATNSPNVDISFNKFTGIIPNTLQGIGLFTANNNLFFGGFPLSLTTNAQSVDLSHNLLNDVRQYGTVAGNPKTGVLSLAFNKLQGPIPTWLTQITSLNQLDISSNQLTGPIPIGLYTLPNIFSLNISNNPLNTMLSVTNNGATISSPLSSLDLHNDQLFGPVPSNFQSAFPNIQFLDLSGNPRLTGTIPHVP